MLAALYRVAGIFFCDSFTEVLLGLVELVCRRGRSDLFFTKSDMLKWIRNISDLIMGTFFGLCGLVIGLNLLQRAGRGPTLLCFDRACVTIQGVTVMALSCLVIVGSVFLALRKQWRKYAYQRRMKLRATRRLSNN